MAGGFYNHYDDPDEDWDEAPLRPTPKTRPADSTAQNQSAPPPPFVRPTPLPESVEWSASSSTPLTSSDPGSRHNQPAALSELDSLLDDLAKFHGYTKEISNLMQEAFSAGPERTTAHDSTGTVEVTVTGAGELTQVNISDNWHRHLTPDGVGPALVDAVNNAEKKRLELTGIAAVENGTIDKIEALDVGSSPATRFVPPEPAPYQPVSIEQILEDALKKLDEDPAESRVEEFAAAVGGDDELQVSVTLNKSGIVDCIVRVPWGMDVGGSQIAWAIKESYDQAYRQLAASNSRKSETSPSTLINDAIQAIANLQIFPPTGM
ncbi:hypothetical protein [Nocardia colli]|uniref:hypothetical protein n=1 Tax=Nocardia colli TaxID=2545717 RepID=UPI0035DB6815